METCLPVFDGGPEVGHFEGLVLGGGLLVGAQTPEDAGAVVGREEFCFVGKIMNHPVGCYAY